MLELLELIGRAISGIFRVGDALEFLGHLFNGMFWWFSPSYRSEVKNYETSAKIAVYLGAFTFLGLLVIVSFIIFRCPFRTHG